MVRLGFRSPSTPSALVKKIDLHFRKQFYSSQTDIGILLSHEKIQIIFFFWNLVCFIKPELSVIDFSLSITESSGFRRRQSYNF